MYTERGRVWFSAAICISGLAHVGCGLLAERVAYGFVIVNVRE